MLGRWFFHVIIVLLAAAGAGWVIAATLAWGLGVSPDSVTYLATAEQFAQGWGFVPHGEANELATPHFPPLFPMVLAALTAGNDDLRVVARWLQVALIAVNVVLVALLGTRAAGRVGGLVAALLVAANGVVLDAHSWLLSEPMAIAFTFAALLLLADGLAPAAARNRRRWLLLGAALATAAACLTRYAAISLIAAGALAIVTAPVGAWRQRLVDAVTFAVIATAPLGLWVLRNRMLVGTGTNRRLSWNGIGDRHLEQLRLALEQWASWPDNSRAFLIAALATAAAVCAAAWAQRRRAARPRSEQDLTHGEAKPMTVVRPLLLFAACYIALVLTTIAFLDRSTPLDSRLLLPLQVALVVPAMTLAWALLSRLRHGGIVATGLVAFMAAANLTTSVPLAKTLAADGHGFSARWWTRSPTLKHARTIPTSQPIYSNAPEVLYVHLRRPARLLARGNDPDLPRRLRWEGAAVLWFDRYKRSGSLDAEQVIVRKLGLIRVARLTDGAIYRAGSPTTAP